MQQVLADGFAGKNLLQIADGCTESLQASRFPAAALVLETVCVRVGRWWDESPVSVNEATKTKKQLAEPVQATIQALGVGDSEEVEAASRRLAEAFIEWRE